jgi:hypothetical protein
MWPFKKKLKKELTSEELLSLNRYKVIEQTVEFDEFEATVWLQLVDGSQITFKKLGHINSLNSTATSLITGEPHNWQLGDYIKENIAHVDSFVYEKPSMYTCEWEYMSQAHAYVIKYKNDSGVVVKVNEAMAMQSSIDIKPTGNKVTAIERKLELK